MGRGWHFLAIWWTGENGKLQREAERGHVGDERATAPEIDGYRIIFRTRRTC